MSPTATPTTPTRPADAHRHRRLARVRGPGLRGGRRARLGSAGTARRALHPTRRLALPAAGGHAGCGRPDREGRGGGTLAQLRVVVRGRAARHADDGGRGVLRGLRPLRRRPVAAVPGHRPGHRGPPRRGAPRVTALGPAHLLAGHALRVRRRGGCGRVDAAVGGEAAARPRGVGGPGRGARRAHLPSRGRPPAHRCRRPPEGPAVEGPPVPRRGLPRRLSPPASSPPPWRTWSPSGTSAPRSPGGATPTSSEPGRPAGQRRRYARAAPRHREDPRPGRRRRARVGGPRAPRPSGPTGPAQGPPRGGGRRRPGVRPDPGHRRPHQRPRVAVGLAGRRPPGRAPPRRLDVVPPRGAGVAPRPGSPRPARLAVRHRRPPGRPSAATTRSSRPPCGAPLPTPPARSSSTRTRPNGGRRAGRSPRGRCG